MKECQHCADYEAYYTKECGIYKKENMGLCKRFGKLTHGSELCYCWKNVSEQNKNVKS